MNKRIVMLIVLTLIPFVFPNKVEAMRITSLDRSSAKGGETIVIRGSDLKTEGTQSCTYYPPGSKTIVWGTCKFKISIAAMKKEPAYHCPRPLSYLSIVSASSTEITVKIPTVMQDGAGQWYISLGGEYDNGDEFMVGGGELPIMISDVAVGSYKCVQKDGTIIEQSSSQTTSPSPQSSIAPEVVNKLSTILPEQDRKLVGVELISSYFEKIVRWWNRLWKR